MKIIVLHDYGNSKEITIFVDNICTLKESNNGTYVSMASGETDFVSENKSYIIKEIKNFAVNLDTF